MGQGFIQDFRVGGRNKMHAQRFDDILEVIK